jgi:hypothetical protein
MAALTIVAVVKLTSCTGSDSIQVTGGPYQRPVYMRTHNGTTFDAHGTCKIIYFDKVKKGLHISVGSNGEATRVHHMGRARDMLIRSREYCTTQTHDPASDLAKPDTRRRTENDSVTIAASQIPWAVSCRSRR